MPPPVVRGSCPNCQAEYSLEVPDDLMKRFFNCSTCKTDLSTEDGLPLGWQEFTKNPKEEGMKIELEKTSRVPKSPEEAMKNVADSQFEVADAQRAIAEQVMKQSRQISVSINVQVYQLGSMHFSKNCQPEERLDVAKDLIEFGIELDAWVRKRLPRPSLTQFVDGPRVVSGHASAENDQGCADSAQGPAANPSEFRRLSPDGPSPNTPEFRVNEQDMKVIVEHDRKMDEVTRRIGDFEEKLKAQDGKRDSDSSRGDPGNSDSSKN